MHTGTVVNAIGARKRALLFGLIALACVTGYGQMLPGALNTKTPEAKTAAMDPLGRTNPREAIHEFLEACHAGNFTRAAQYLDLTKVPPGADVRERARILGLLLDRDPHFELQQLADTPEGSLEDGLAPDMERLVTLNDNGRTVALYMQRVKRRSPLGDQDVWLVSADSVGRLPELANLVQESALEKHLPPVLVRTQLLSTPIWVWLALVLCAGVIGLISRLLSRAALALARPLAKRFWNELAALRLQLFVDPLRLLLGIAVFRACIVFAPPSALLRDALLKALAVLFMIGAASLVMRVIDLFADQYIARLDPKERSLSYSLLPLLGRLVKMCIFFIAVLIVLRDWGVDITAVLAGLGVGGLAVALAAQKTIENLFGGISVISDRPVLVGDFCQFGGQTGTVVDIGLRSTRIRTLDRTLVTVPNSQFSTMTLENFSRRDRFWFHPTLALRRDTPEAKIPEAMQAVEKVLRENARVDPTDVPVRFTKVTAEAYVLEIFSYVLTSEVNEFMQVQSELLLALLSALSDIGVRLTVPFQENITYTSNSATSGT